MDKKTLSALTLATLSSAAPACNAYDYNADLEVTRQKVNGHSIAAAMKILRDDFERSCAGDKDMNLDALIAVRDEVGGDLLLKDETRWVCGGSSQDCFLATEDCQTWAPTVDIQTSWVVDPQNTNLLTNLYVNESAVARRRTMHAYQVAGDAASAFTQECVDTSKRMGDKKLTRIIEKRNDTLEKDGYVSTQGWKCTQTAHTYTTAQTLKDGTVIHTPTILKPNNENSAQ